jgi:3-dehydroquinate synthase
MKPIIASQYSVVFHSNNYLELNQILKENNYSSIFILTDENTNEFCLPLLLPYLETEITIEIIEIEAGELNKNIETCTQIWSILSDFNADRKSVLINLGGGVVTDLGGFIASTFKRGIDYINIPTTLLGMVDASIGGKNGVDLGNLKNQIGTITHPKMVYVDSNYLKTLSQRELKSGLAEMLKHGLIYDENYWKEFEEIEELNFNQLDSLIYTSVQIKNDIVSQDPTENGIRKALNFGHTLGHAIESFYLHSETPLLHGEAIAVGMILESYISVSKNLLTNNQFIEIKKIIQKVYTQFLIPEKDIDAILEMLIHDKKNEYGKIQFTLLEKIGKSCINQSVENTLLQNSFKELHT